MCKLAEVRRSQGRLADAEQLYREALAGYQRRLGPEHPMVGTAYAELGKVVAEAGRYGEAETALLEGERILRAAKAAPSKGLSDCIGTLVDLYEAWDKA